MIYGNELVECLSIACNNVQRRLWIVVPFIGNWKSVERIIGTKWITDISIDAVFVLLDAYLYQTPPSGYSFIPTITNVFGVVDYYLGINGDSGTGCNLF